jgi:hypothetical protein
MRRCYSGAWCVVVWGTYPGLTGPYGHVAVAVTADPESIVSYDQNWANSPCHVRIHSSGGVLGW